MGVSIKAKSAGLGSPCGRAAKVICLLLVGVCNVVIKPLEHLGAHWVILRIYCERYTFGVRSAIVCWWRPMAKTTVRGKYL